MYTNIQNLVEELIKTKQLLKEAEAELKSIKEKKEKRAVAANRNRKKSPEEKEFIKILKTANTRLNSQEYKDAVTFNRIIKKKIAEEKYGEYNFFSFYNSRIYRLMNFTPFVSDCKDCGLNIEAVAQYVASRGENTINSVFKNGLVSTIGKDNLSLMDKQIFSSDELNLAMYKPQRHPDLFEADSDVEASSSMDK